MPYTTLGEYQIHYIHKGNGETLIIFPDNIHAAQAYEQEIAYFSANYSVIAFDYPGFGGSSHEQHHPDEIQVDYFGFRADLVCHLLVTHHIESCHVLGVGGGALAALHFAGNQAFQHQLKVRSLIADSFLADFDKRTLHRWLDTREHFYVRNIQRLETWHGNDWRMLLDRDTCFLRGLADRGGYAVPDKILNSISCPVLLTGHLRDAALPGLAREYARLSDLIPDCTLYLSGKSGHSYLERPFAWSDPSAFRLVADLFLERVTAK